MKWVFILGVACLIFVVILIVRFFSNPDNYR